ncbi:SprT-like domain-containing protein [Caldalkalibacillus salinus]|uniref:SprT-like domain-containing protein n=1 Tax=Caldalkalibacillus salinus TaxID=2803787 RepID=UPI0019208866|nr:SprT-like domain-containing protein [Caldalkalibacillus salinus]
MKHQTDLRHIDDDPAKLQSLADKLSQHFWEKPCSVPVTWNGRLQKSMGRFLFTAHGKKKTPIRIELSKHAAHFITREIFIAVLLHELCHYHLFIQNKPYEDHHPVFEKELRRVGAISTNSVQIPQKGFDLYCSQCQGKLGTRKRFNTQKYLSGCCKAKVIKEDTLIGSFQYSGQILRHSKINFLNDSQSND